MDYSISDNRKNLHPSLGEKVCVVGHVCVTYLGCSFILYIKINFSWIKDLNVRVEIEKTWKSFPF